MTRQECEMKLADLMEQAYRLFKEFDQTGRHLSMFATDDGCCAMGYSGQDGNMFNIIDGFKAANGCYRLSEQKGTL